MAENNKDQNRAISGTNFLVSPGKSFGFSDRAAITPGQRERKLPPEPGSVPRNLPVPTNEVLSQSLLEQFNDPEFRDIFVSEHVRTRLALLIRALREQRGWSQSEMGRRLGKSQSVVARLENPDYRLSLQTVFEVAAVFGLPVYIDMPDWDDWFRMMSDMSAQNLGRQSFIRGETT